MAKVKICGLNDGAGLDAAIAAGADWIGFVFFPPSPRYASPSMVRALLANRKDLPQRVGLFVKPTEAMIAEALDEVQLDILQLYTSPENAAALRVRCGLPVWRATPVSAPADLPRSLDGVDALLVESKPPLGATRPGGNAVRFDWTLTRDWPAPGPWILAGGLDPDNVAEAIQQSGATAVDVSSGVERTRGGQDRGVKDPALIDAFIRRARGGT